MVPRRNPIFRDICFRLIFQSQNFGKISEKSQYRNLDDSCWLSDIFLAPCLALDDALEDVREVCLSAMFLEMVDDVLVDVSDESDDVAAVFWETEDFLTDFSDVVTAELDSSVASDTAVESVVDFVAVALADLLEETLTLVDLLADLSEDVADFTVTAAEADFSEETDDFEVTSAEADFSEDVADFEETAAVADFSWDVADFEAAVDDLLATATDLVADSDFTEVAALTDFTLALESLRATFLDSAVLLLAEDALLVAEEPLLLREELLFFPCSFFSSLEVLADFLPTLDFFSALMFCKTYHSNTGFIKALYYVSICNAY